MGGKGPVVVTSCDRPSGLGWGGGGGSRSGVWMFQNLLLSQLYILIYYFSIFKFFVIHFSQVTNNLEILTSNSYK